MKPAPDTAVSSIEGPIKVNASGESPLLTLRKSFSLGTALAIVRLACSFISIKLTAVYLGPSGLALIAQFSNFVSLCQGIVITGLETAAGRLTSEYVNDAPRRRVLLFTLGKVALCLALPVALLVSVFSSGLASWLLHDSGLAWVFLLGAVGIVATILNAVLLAVASARGGITKVAVSNMLATVCGLLIFAPSSIHWGAQGGLFASSAVYVCTLLVTLIVLRHSGVVKLSEFVGRLDWGEVRRIAGFYPMLITHAAMVPLSLILVRQHVMSALSIESAGLWQACWRLSETYLMVVMTSVSMQFMVRLGQVINSPQLLRAEVLRTLAMSVGATAAMAAGIFIMREWIVRLVFSSAFLPVSDLMPMQLLGDVLRMVGWTFGFVLVATYRTRWYIAIEITVPLVFIGTARYLGAEIGVGGVTIAYALSSLVHSLLSITALRDVLFRRRLSVTSTT